MIFYTVTLSSLGIYYHLQLQVQNYQSFEERSYSREHYIRHAVIIVASDKITENQPIGLHKNSGNCIEKFGISPTRQHKKIRISILVGQPPMSDNLFAPPSVQGQLASLRSKDEAAEADSKEQATEKNMLVATTPPPNDRQDRELYPGDREVIFIGAYCVQVSAVGLHLMHVNSGPWDGRYW